MIAGRTLALQFSDPLLAELLVAGFSHLARATGKADLTVVVGANDRTQTPMVEPPWGWKRGELQGVFDRHHIHAPGLDAHAAADGTFSLVDWSTNTGVWWFADSAHIPGFERAKPCRLVLHWWASRLGGVLLHSAAVGTEAGGIVLVGSGGSGKSTTSLACLGTELLYLGDDYTLLTFDEADDSPVVHSLFCSGTLGPKSHELLPHLVQYEKIGSEPPLQKTVMFVPPELPWCSTSLPVRALVAPVVTDSAKSEIVPISRTQALRSAAPSTVLALPGDIGPRLKVMADLVRRVPAFQLRLGADVDVLPQLLAGVINAN